MTASVWYSAAVKIHVIVGEAQVVNVVRSIIVFRSKSYDEALRAALNFGRGLETSYVNGDQQNVRWALAEIETLDELDEVMTDGREVYSEGLGPLDGVRRLVPEESKPTQSGV